MSVPQRQVTLLQPSSLYSDVLHLLQMRSRACAATPLAFSRSECRHG